MKKTLFSIFSVAILLCCSCSKEEETPVNNEQKQIAGCLSGEFTVDSVGTKVRFSKGNLQYQASTGTWRFAEHQWDTIGAGNNNIDTTYDGWIDLFGWGTSGYHNSSDSNNTNYYPYSISTSKVDATYNYFGYGPSTNMTDANLTGTSANYDWGVYNAISNGGNAAGLWRTLTYSEWKYLLATRANADSLYGKATVNGVNGIIFLPDSWTLPAGLSFTPLKRQGISVSYDNNNYTAEQWAKMEAAGAVLLPAAGYRSGSNVRNAGQRGYYWSSTALDNSYAYGLYFNSGNVNALSDSRNFGRSVRLVR